MAFPRAQDLPRTPILVRGGRLVTMDAERRVVRADVLIEDGRIARIGSIRAPRGARVLEAGGAAVIPGLVQAHVHLCQALLRNHADGLELLEWLKQRVWPF